jgi:hypothetical protein
MRQHWLLTRFFKDYHIISNLCFFSSCLIRHSSVLLLYLHFWHRRHWANNRSKLPVFLTESWTSCFSLTVSFTSASYFQEYSAVLIFKSSSSLFLPGLHYSKKGLSQGSENLHGFQNPREKKIYFWKFLFTRGIKNNSYFSFYNLKLFQSKWLKNYCMLMSLT